MLADSLLVPECVFRPGSFTGLMTLYESNFIKLAGLIEPLGAQRPRQLDPAVSVTPNDCDLYLRPVSFERYTTTIKLTYMFDAVPADSDARIANESAVSVAANAVASSAGSVVERIADPDLMVRIYHDARLVEAVRGADTHQHHKLQEFAAQELGGVHSLELDRRWRNNIMLNKWLDYVIDMGHKFR